VDGFTTEDRNV